MINQKDFDFTGQRILITGAAGGIGLAIAKIFSCHGAELILADIKTDEFKKQVKTLGDNISLHHYDIVSLYHYTINIIISYIIISLHH